MGLKPVKNQAPSAEDRGGKGAGRLKWRPGSGGGLAQAARRRESSASGRSRAGREAPPRAIHRELRAERRKIPPHHRGKNQMGLLEPRPNQASTPQAAAHPAAPEGRAQNKVRYPAALKAPGRFRDTVSLRSAGTARNPLFFPPAGPEIGPSPEPAASG